MFGRKKKFFQQNGGLLLKREENDGKIKIFKGEELRKATNNFSKMNRLGEEGDYNTVYRGTLPSGTQVAVKEFRRLEFCNNKKTKKSGEAGKELLISEFITEVVSLSQMLHRNIVKLLGCCLETETPLLVYEYLVNRDLSHHLHDNAEFPLSWEVRLRIAAEIAGALSYLHSSTGIHMYHRDIASENILLDSMYTAKLANFGILLSFISNQSGDSLGTVGYIDPEYMDTGKYTDKSEVYSFGVVLAELLTGKRPVYSYTSLENGEEYTVILANYFESLEVGKIMETFLDVRVKHQGKGNEVEDVIKLAKRCLEREGRNRPKMKDVAIQLEKIRSAQTELYEEQELMDHDHQQMEISYFTRQDTTFPSLLEADVADQECKASDPNVTTVEDMDPSILHQQYEEEADDQPCVAASDPDFTRVQDMNPPRHQQYERVTKPHVADPKMSSQGQERKASGSVKVQKHSNPTGQIKWPLIGQRNE